MRRALILLAFALAAAEPAVAQGHRIPAKVVSVVDGDTIKVDANTWPGETKHTNVRLLGMDAPEIFRPNCAAERRKGEAARAYAEKIIGGSGQVWLINVKYDKYGGRVAASIRLANGRDFAREMIAAGHARPYRGGQRGSWC